MFLRKHRLLNHKAVESRYFAETWCHTRIDLLVRFAVNLRLVLDLRVVAPLLRTSNIIYILVLNIDTY